jgi:acylphosphatase
MAPEEPRPKAQNRVHLIIHGDVQGVFFRDFVNKTANILKLKGWVRNAPEGTVEVVAEGEKENLNELIERCKKGPPFASVENISIEWAEATEEFSDFTTRY